MVCLLEQLIYNNMGVLKEIGRFTGNVLNLIVYAVRALIKAAIWSIGQVVDLFTDILSWINNQLDNLLKSGADTVDVVKGSSLAEFIKQNQATGKYTEISLGDLQKLDTSVVNVALNSKGEVVDDQMILSNNGLSSETKEQFKNQPILKIKLPA